MQHILLNCCCSAPPAAKASYDDEAVDGATSVYKSHFVNDEGKVNAVALSPAGGGGMVAIPAIPPSAASQKDGTKEEKDSAKARLQQLIRDFARDAVGPGIPVEVESAEVTPAQCRLQMDKGLRHLEFRKEERTDGHRHVQLMLPLVDVDSVSKVGGQSPPNPREDQALVVNVRAGPPIRIFFDSSATRDKAHTCLRIFQMSVEQQPSPREGSLSASEDGGDSARGQSPTPTR